MTVAQNQPASPGFQRVPIMEAGTLDDRTRPLSKGPTPIWLRHRLRRRGGVKGTSPAGRARMWLRQLAGASDPSRPPSD